MRNNPRKIKKTANKPKLLNESLDLVSSRLGRISDLLAGRQFRLRLPNRLFYNGAIPAMCVTVLIVLNQCLFPGSPTLRCG